MLSDFPTMHQNKMREEGAQDIVNVNKTKFGLYGDLVDQAFLQYNESFKTHRAKLKKIKHQGHIVPMNIIQKTQKQTKLLQFPILCPKY